MAHHGSIFGSNNAYVQVGVKQPGAAPVDNDQWIAQSPYPTVNPGQVFMHLFHLSEHRQYHLEQRRGMLTRL